MISFFPAKRLTLLGDQSGEFLSCCTAKVFESVGELKEHVCEHLQDVGTIGYIEPNERETAMVDIRGGPQGHVQ